MLPYKLASLALFLLLSGCAEPTTALPAEGLGLPGEVLIEELHVEDDGQRLSMRSALTPGEKVACGVLYLSMAGPFFVLMLLAARRRRTPAALAYATCLLTVSFLLASTPTSREATFRRDTGTLHLKTMRALPLLTDEVTLRSHEVASLQMLWSYTEYGCIYALEVVGRDGRQQIVASFTSPQIDMSLAEAFADHVAAALGAPRLPTERRFAVSWRYFTE